MTDRLADPGLDVSAIQQRADAATPGPWGPRDADGEFELSYGDFGWSVHFPSGRGVETEDSEQGKADATFIAAARSDIPALLDAYREACRQRDEARAESEIGFTELADERTLHQQTIVERDALLTVVRPALRVALREVTRAGPVALRHDLLAAVAAYENRNPTGDSDG